MCAERSRRDFLKASAGAGLGLTLGAAGPAPRNGDGARAAPGYEIPAGYLSSTGFAAEPLDTVRIGFVGVGLQGGSHVQNFLGIEGVEVRAICDIDLPRAREVARWVVEDGRPEPALYTRGETDYRRLCERDDLDLVFSATPWRWHVPVCVEAMHSGKHAAVEVPAAYTVEGCWELVETAEREARHCIMMENCCYDRRELMILGMVRAGLLGEILHAECGYLHDLRAIKFSDVSEGLWRLAHSVARNGNLYPTHGIGPVAQCLDINRGDRFEYLVSASSPQRGLSLYAERNLAADDPRRGREYALGDMNTSIVKTRRGRTIMIQHDTTTPRPYSRINLVQGTAGVAAGYPDRVHIEGRTEPHEWDDLESYRDEFDHRLWRELEEAAAGARHGGMDYLEDYRLVECLRAGTPLDMDVYDAASWSVITALSERSVAEGSRPVEFPDFTRGRWPDRVAVV